MSAHPPVLLTVGQFYGTLAAARCLGRAGIPVTLAEGHLLAPTRWSRWVTRRVRCPEVIETEAFLAWLLDLGAASPGHVLLPTSDDTAWLFAENHAALSAHYHLIPVPFPAIEAVLDKRALFDECKRAGLDLPDTWFPESPAEAEQIAAKTGFPLLIKPRSQVLHPSGSKGALVTSPEELGPLLTSLSAPDLYGARVRARTPEIVRPMLQRYYPAARENIYGLSGYAGQGGEILAIRASRKILQRPRKLGIGLCFEEAQADEPTVRKLETLCRNLGYRGVFEVEMVELDGRRAVIDFNPRFFSQMAFDIDRGMPLPRLAYADALGDETTLRALAEEARAGRAAGDRVYCHRGLFELMLRAQGLSGRLRPDEQERWRTWWRDHRQHATDAVIDLQDPLPWGVDTVAQLTWFARHPRSFVRSMVLDR